MALTDLERLRLAREHLYLRDTPLESWTFEELERLKNLIIEADEKIDGNDPRDMRRIRAVKKLWTDVYLAFKNLKGHKDIAAPGSSGQASTPRKAYRLEFNDRRLLRSMGIVSDDDEPEPENDEDEPNGNK